MGKFPIREKNKKKCKTPKTTQKMKTLKTNNKK
jgi:nucleoid DNA-binding protein